MTTLVDTFDLAAIRARVLDTWRASPARFREDANSEEDLVRGGYRDRVVIELAANAADAAAAAGIAGQVRFELRDEALVVSNIGAPLTADGVVALSALRASAKRDIDLTVGRYGVGFAAVLAVTDDPRIESRHGGVSWSATATRALVADIESLTDEFRRREGGVPVLRLPFPAGATAGEWDTVVTLPLRDDAARVLARRLLDEIDAALLMTLPALASVEIVTDGRTRRLAARRDGREVVVDDTGETTRWRVASRVARVDPTLLVDRPIEERAQATVQVTCAVPVDVTGRPAIMPSTVPPVVHAPAPTDERLALPILLIATLPLDPSRRHIAPGAFRDYILGIAAHSYVDLLVDLAGDPAVLELVPAGLPGGEVDAVLRRRILELLPNAPILATVRPADAVVADVPAAATEVLAEVLPGLVPADWAQRQAPLAVLGVPLLTLADVAAALAGLDRPPSWWHGLYAAFATGHLGAVERDALAALPVPLVDGRLVNGARGLLIPSDEVPAEALRALGLRAVHPAAAHPLLLQLGAVEATPRAVLEDPGVRSLVAASYDEGNLDIAPAVLALVATAGVRAGELPWLADLTLPAEDGETYPAGELLLPTSALRRLVAVDSPFGVVAADALSRWGAEVLTAVGVLDTFAVAREHDAVGATHDLDAEDEWWATLPEGASVPDFVAIRDLEFVDPAQSRAALQLLAAPPLREAIVEPAIVDTPRGLQRVPSYTAWWLANHPVLDGWLPTQLMIGGLPGLYDAAPDYLDEEFLRAIGVWAGLDDVVRDADGMAGLLSRLTSGQTPVDRRTLARIYAAIAESPAARELPPPELVAAVFEGEVVVVPAERAVVADAPDLLPLLGSRAVLPVSAALAADLADVLAVPVASELPAYEPVTTGHAVEDHMLHDPLLVPDIEGQAQPVAWRYLHGTLHVDARRRAFGLGRGRAWIAGEWSRRHVLTVLLAGDGDAAELLAESDLD